MRLADINSVPRYVADKYGFSLIQMSIVLTVAALAMAAMLPGEETGNYSQKALNSIQKLQKVEDATKAFMAMNQRRPCPADGQYDIGSHNFGLEAATPGTCTGGTPAAPLGPDGTGNIIGGVIPTKTLGLPDDYAFDEWGRRFTYLVDKRATSKGACLSLQGNITAPFQNNGTGGIVIKDTTSGGNTLDNVMAAYISHGASGHGAFPAQGSSAVNRINAGVTDTDMVTDAALLTFTNARVRKDKTATFDDLVYYADYMKNTCCVGPTCTRTGVRFDDLTAGEEAGYSIAYGDVNGDGIADLIIGVPYSATGGSTNQGGSVYVILGQAGKLAWPSTPASLATGAGNLIDGVHGFRFDGPTSYANFGWSVTTGNILGHTNGVVDIIVGAPNYSPTFPATYPGSVYIIYGSKTPTWTATQKASTLIDGVKGVRLDGETNGNYFGSSVTVGDINHDGVADLLIGAMYANPNSLAYPSGSVYVIYGSATPSWSATQTVNPTYLAGGGTAVNGFRLDGGTSGEELGMSLATGDINNDNYADIIAGVPNAGFNGYSGGSTYVIFGKAAAGWATTQSVNANWLSGNNVGCAPGSTTCSGILAVNGFRLDDYGSHGGNETSGYNVASGDINGDGFQDIVIGAPQANNSNLGGEGSTYVIFGGTGPAGGGSWSTTQIMNPAFLNGTNGFRLDGEAGGDNTGYALAVGDVNGDGKADIVTGGWGVGGVTSASSTYVVFGKSSGWSASQVMNSTFLNGGGSALNGVRFDGDAAHRYWSQHPMACGDINRDGKAEIMIGAYKASPNGNAAAGSVYTIFGKSSKWTTPITLNSWIQ